MIASGAGSDAVWVRETGKAEGWRKLDLPTTLAAMPLVWGRALLVPGVDGRAYLIDPLTARSKAEPLVPVYSIATARSSWLAPARLDAQGRGPGRRRGPRPPAGPEAGPGRRGWSSRPRRRSTRRSSPTRRRPARP